MNTDKLAKMKANVRTGGKHSVRRKKKVVKRRAGAGDQKLNSVLKRLNVNTIPGIDEVNMFKSDGTVIHFQQPKGSSLLLFLSILSPGFSVSAARAREGLLQFHGPLFL